MASILLLLPFAFTSINATGSRDINVSGSWNWVRTLGYKLNDKWCDAKGHDPWHPKPEAFNITMNLTQHDDNSITGFCMQGGGNLTGFLVNTEAVPLMVLNRRHFNGSYIKSTGVNAYFLGHLVSPGLFNMSFTNDYGYSCSSVTLTPNTPGAEDGDIVSSSMTSTGKIAADYAATAAGLPPLNCSWTTKWFKGPQAPITALSLQETAAGSLQGSCTAAPPAPGVQADVTAGGGDGCTVIRADQLPRQDAKPRRIVQVNMRVSDGRLVVLAATLCPGGACGMVQWISGDGESGQLSLVPSADSACSSPPPATTAAALMSKTLLPGTRCMDGTPSGYYYAAPPKNSTVWVINMKGGGGCGDEKKCASRVNTDLGSSKGWSATREGTELISDDPAVNPDFAAAHHVHIPYCSSDGHTGMRNTTSKESWGYYFAGHLNFAAIVRDLSTKLGLGSATQVLLTGESAGGIGVIHNLDWFADALGPGVTVKGAPTAGWFMPGALPADFPHNPHLPPPSYACFAAGRPASAACASASEAGGKASDELYQSYRSPACAAAQAAGEAWHCNSAHVLYPFIRTPIYVVENQYDTNQLYTQERVPKSPADAATQRAYIAMYGEAMRNSTAQVLANAAKRDGLFLPSCLQHGLTPRPGDPHTPKTPEKISSQTWQAILGDWFFGRGQLSKYHQLVDDCTMVDGLPCNAAEGCQLEPAPPPAAGCQKQVDADGCLTAGTQKACFSCIHKHQMDLKAAGCSTSAVRTQCPSALA